MSEKSLREKAMEANVARTEISGKYNTKWTPGAIDKKRESEHTKARIINFQKMKFYLMLNRILMILILHTMLKNQNKQQN